MQKVIKFRKMLTKLQTEKNETGIEIDGQHLLWVEK